MNRPDNRRDPRADGRARPDRDGQAEIITLDPAAYDFPARPVADVELLQDSVDIARHRGFNLLCPVIHLPPFSEDFVAVVRLLHFSTGGRWVTKGGKRSNGIWYEEEGGYALHKVPLRMIAAAAGASLGARRMDDRSVPSFWEFCGWVRHRTMDGSWRTVEATKDLDLRENGDLVKSWHANAARKRDGGNAGMRIEKAREVGGRMCESKAVNAAIRDAFGIQLCYSPEEADRIFVFPYLIYRPRSPEARAMQAAVELGAVGTVFGPGAAVAAPRFEHPTPETPSKAPEKPAVAQRAAPTRAPAREPERRALPDHGAPNVPDFERANRELADSMLEDRYEEPWWLGESEAPARREPDRHSPRGYRSR